VLESANADKRRKGEQHMDMLERITRVLTGAVDKQQIACTSLCQTDGKIDPWRLAALLG
jgi:hypothetical protein